MTWRSSSSCRGGATEIVRQRAPADSRSSRSAARPIGTNSRRARRFQGGTRRALRDAIASTSGRHARAPQAWLQVGGRCGLGQRAARLELNALSGTRCGRPRRPRPSRASSAIDVGDAEADVACDRRRNTLRDRRRTSAGVQNPRSQRHCRLPRGADARPLAIALIIEVAALEGPAQTSPTECRRRRQRRTDSRARSALPTRAYSLVTRMQNWENPPTSR